MYLGLWTAMIVGTTAGVSYWITLLLVIPCAFAHIRVFILFHDCCHGSLFSSRRANIAVGHLTGILTFTNYETWRRSHLKHHATNAQLDHRGVGDVWTMTVDEFSRSSVWTRLKYRLFRSPVVMFVIGPLYLFVLKYRLSSPGASLRERISTAITNVGLLGIAVGVSILIGPVAFISLQLPVLLISGMIGIWLFYVQHQFDPGYWSRDETWDEIDAALQGSSYYRMPRLFQWICGHIGIHHIHHLLPQIPNYRLRACYNENPEVQVARPLTVRRSLASLRMKLWSETDRKFISFGESRKLEKMSANQKRGRARDSRNRLGIYSLVRLRRRDQEERAHEADARNI